MPKHTEQKITKGSSVPSEPDLTAKQIVQTVHSEFFLEDPSAIVVTFILYSFCGQNPVTEFYLQESFLTTIFGFHKHLSNIYFCFDFWNWLHIDE